MSFRIERFVDKENSLVRVPEAGFPTSSAFRHATNVYYTDFPTVQQLLKEERRNNQLYDKIWNIAETTFKAKKQLLLNQNKQSIPKECHIAIIAYTLDDSVDNVKLYQDFNKKCRELNDDDNSWKGFPYKSLYMLLSRSIHGVRSKPDINTYAYRGVDLHYSMDSLKKDDLVSFNQFTSCTTDSKVAEGFKKGKPGTVIEFPGRAMASIGIANYSPYEESEVLIFPWSTFIVSEIERNGASHRIVLNTAGPFSQILTYSEDWAQFGAAFKY